MSQRECSGLNWPPLAVSASDPVGSCPESAYRLCRASDCPLDPYSSATVIRQRSGRQSRAVGVAHEHSATVLRLLSVLPAALYVSVAGEPAIGVGHPANKAAMHKSCGDPLRSISLKAPSSVRTFFSPSLLRAVGQPHRCTATSASPICGSAGLRPVMIGGRGFASTKWLFGVGQEASDTAACASVSPKPLFPYFAAYRARRASKTPLFVAPNSCALGVGHEVQPVSDVRSADARSRKRDRPEGVTQGFQVILNKVDPRPAVSACNLLTKDSLRAVLADEVVPGWPQVPLVSKPSAFACRAERLARTGTGPNRSIVGDAGQSQGMRPDADAGEEVALREAAQVGGMNVLDAAFIDDAIGDVSGGDEVAEPSCCIGVYLVVVGRHAAAPSPCPALGHHAACSASGLRFCGATSGPGTTTLGAVPPPLAGRVETHSRTC